MSVFYCEVCEKLIDSDFVEAVISPLDEYKLICQKHIDCCDDEELENEGLEE
jgi:hypothetical protein